MFRKDLIALLGLFCTVVLLVCCASTPRADTSQDEPNMLTHGGVQLTLRTGQTTQVEIVEAFGAPNIATRDASGHEVWTYRRHASVTRASGSDAYFNILIFGTSGYSKEQTSSSRTMTLIIKFDENNVVYDFRSRSSSF